MGEFESRFRAETWSEYSIGMVFILLRLYARYRKLGGFRAYQIDDWVTVGLIVWYTLLIVSINKIIFGGGSNFMTPEEEAALTPETRQQRITGSKWVLVSEQMIVLTVWSCKVCMLFIYGRLTKGLKQSRLITAVAIWVGCGFLAVQIAFFSNCRPFWGYWSVPAISKQCWSYFNYEYVEGVFNITADLAMLLVAIPLIWKVKLPIQQKGPLLAIFGMGVFVIGAALMTKLYTFYPPLLSYEYLNWFSREASVSVYVTNLPAIWTLARDTFPALREWGYRTPTHSRVTPPWPSSIGRSDRGTTNHTLQSFDRIESGDDRSQERIMGASSLHIKQDFSFSVEENSNHFDETPTAPSSVIHGATGVPGATATVHCSVV